MTRTGYRVIKREEVIKIITEEGILTANCLADKLKRNYRTAKKRLDDLCKEGIIKKTSYKAKYNYEISLYEMNENEPTNTTPQ